MRHHTLCRDHLSGDDHLATLTTDPWELHSTRERRDGRADSVTQGVTRGTLLTVCCITKARNQPRRTSDALRLIHTKPVFSKKAAVVRPTADPTLGWVQRALPGPLVDGCELKIACRFIEQGADSFGQIAGHAVIVERPKRSFAVDTLVVGAPEAQVTTAVRITLAVFDTELLQTINARVG